MSESLIHVVRERPTWATGTPLRLCGNRARQGDLSVAEMADYIQRECRGAVKVAYATCCVTCVDALSRYEWELRRDRGEQRAVSIVTEYLQRSEKGRQGECPPRKAIELAALDALVESHWNEYEASIERLQQQAEWRRKSRQEAARRA